jgi:hypothetical protein
MGEKGSQTDIREKNITEISQRKTWGKIHNERQSETFK